MMYLRVTLNLVYKNELSCIEALRLFLTGIQLSEDLVSGSKNLFGVKEQRIDHNHTCAGRGKFYTGNICIVFGRTI